MEEHGKTRETIIESPDNAVLQEDLEILAGSGLADMDWRGASVFVTGATGLLGSQTVKALACLNRRTGAGMHILAFVRNEAKAKKVFGALTDRGDVEVVVGDVGAPIVFGGSVDYVIHGASPTSSRYFVTNPVETICAAVDGTRHVLEFAREKQVKGMVYLSSLEVYGTPLKEEGLITEQDYGVIDPLSVRSSYSEGKRLVECLCASYAKEYQVPVKVARLSQTFGAGVDYQDGRVFAEFARCATEKRDIVLHTQGRTVRSYCYTRDAVSAILYILRKGVAGEAYNVTNMDTAISIREMAELVCETIGESAIRVVSDIPDDVSGFGYNPEMVIRLDAAKLMELGWKAGVGLEEMYRRMTADAWR